MKEIILGNDDITIIVDGVKLNKTKIQELLKTEYKFNNLAAFIQTTFNNDGGVSSEH